MRTGEEYSLVAWLDLKHLKPKKQRFQNNFAHCAIHALLFANHE